MENPNSGFGSQEGSANQNEQQSEGGLHNNTTGNANSGSGNFSRDGQEDSQPDYNTEEAGNDFTQQNETDYESEDEDDEDDEDGDDLDTGREDRDAAGLRSGIL